MEKLISHVWSARIQDDCLRQWKDMAFSLQGSVMSSLFKAQWCRWLLVVVEAKLFSGALRALVPIKLETGSLLSGTDIRYRKGNINNQNHWRPSFTKQPQTKWLIINDLTCLQRHCPQSIQSVLSCQDSWSLCWISFAKAHRQWPVRISTIVSPVYYREDSESGLSSHFKRVIKYARPSDYAAGAASTIAGPGLLLLWERIAPSHVGKGGFAPILRLTTAISAGAGFLLFYNRSIRKAVLFISRKKYPIKIFFT